MQFRPASDLATPVIEWLWPGYLALGSLAILDGDPGIGKSLFTLDLAARLTTGAPWPDGAPGVSPAPVLLLSAEDNAAVVATRLSAAKADRRQAFLWTHQGEKGLPRLPGEHDVIDQALAQTGARLVVIDPIMAFLDTLVVASDAHVRTALLPLAQLAHARNCAILLVRHLNKKEGPQALYRGGGSIAFVAACRLAWLAGRDPNLADRFILAQTKNNHAPLQPSLAYELPIDAPRVAWLGRTGHCADELTMRRKPRPDRLRAQAFLRELLKDGPRTSQEVWNAAVREGHSKNTLNRAKKDLKIFSQPVLGENRVPTYWWLYENQKAPGAPDTPLLDEWMRKWEETYAPKNPLDEWDDEDD